MKVSSLDTSLLSPVNKAVQFKSQLSIYDNSAPPRHIGIPLNEGVQI